jgi:hypothetical protein
MFGKITLAATLIVSGVAFGQNTQQPSSTSNVQTQPANSLPRQCWDTHTNQARPVTAADFKAIPQGPIATTGSTYGGIAPGSKADRPAGMPLCD